MSPPLNLLALIALLPASLLPAQNKAENSGVGVTRTYNLDEFNALEASDPNDPPGGIPGKYMNYKALNGLKQEDFAGMDYDDVRLKTAWMRAVPAIIGDPFDTEDLQGGWTAEYFRTTSEPHWGYAYLDLMRRGEAVVPHVIKLAEEIRGSPQEMWLVTALPVRFGEKYRPMAVDFCRKYIRERPKSPLMKEAVRYLENWGSAEDAELMRWIGSIRPRYTKWMEESVGHLLKRLADEAANPNKVRSDPTKRPPFVKKTQTKSPSTRPLAPPEAIQGSELFTPTPWSIIVALIVAAGGLLWLLLKKRK